MIGSSPGMRRVALLAVAAVVAALLSVAVSGGASGSVNGGASGAAGPVSSTSYSASVAFADTSYTVPIFSRLFGRNESPGGSADQPGAIALAVTSNKYGYFGKLQMDEGSDTMDLTFKVERRIDAGSYRRCPQGSSQCLNMRIRSTPDGLLYFWHGFSTTHDNHWPAALTTQRLEVSASDSDTGLKVYRDVLVNPPPEVPDCEDYGDDSVDAYVCLYMKPLIPDGAVDSASDTSLNHVPNLVQDTSNYRLVFSEEFDGTPGPADSSGCRDGLSTLDESVWNYPEACGWVDARNVPCSNVTGGSLYIAIAYRCGANVNTFGKLHYQYGYFEFKYTINMDGWGVDHNLNLVAQPPHHSRRHVWKQYGVVLRDWEDVLKYSAVEVDFLEYVPRTRHESWIQHANWGNPLSTSIGQHKSTKQFHYCGGTTNPVFHFVVNPVPCQSTDTFTVTKGVEWTPRGYRTFLKVDGFQDDLTLWPKDKMQVWGLSGGRQTVLTGAVKDAFFEYTDPEDTSTLLEQIGIAHSPLPISLAAFGITSSQHNYIRTKVEFDYIRLWQPENHYADMDPLYQ